MIFVNILYNILSRRESSTNFILWFITPFLFMGHITAVCKSAGISLFFHILVIRLLILLHRFLLPYFRSSAVIPSSGGGLYSSVITLLHYKPYCVWVFPHISGDHNIQ